MKIRATVNDQEDLRIRTSTFTTRTIEQLDDVDASNAQDGSVLVYNTNGSKWQATRILEKQIINGGNF